MTNRQQQVKLGNTNSKLLPRCIGVPQGSILGPLLFSIYINVLPKTCLKFHCIMYPDDTTLYNFLENFESNDVERGINCELDKVNLWLKANKLSLNVTFRQMSSGVSRISFRGGFKIFREKWGYLHGAKRHAARGEATCLLGGFGGMLPRENF